MNGIDHHHHSSCAHHHPLSPFRQACLEHRHSYVRKNAALAVLNIHHNVSSDLLPDAPELMDKFIRVREILLLSRSFLFCPCGVAFEA